MKKFSVAFALILLSIFISSIAAYPYMPSKMAIHWDENGTPNGFSSKEIALSIVPIISFFLFLLLIAIPKIDPLKKNIQQFISYYYGMVLLILLFMLLLNISTILSNISINFITDAVLIGMAAIMFYVAILLKHAKMNWFVGIRTPWTLSSEEVWNKTHEIGSKLFLIIAVVTLASIFFPYKVWVLIISIISVSLFLVIYSYHEYRKEVQ